MTGVGIPFVFRKINKIYYSYFKLGSSQVRYLVSMTWIKNKYLDWIRVKCYIKINITVGETRKYRYDKSSVTTKNTRKKFYHETESTI